MTDLLRKRVLVLCTGNSCRSQMAEAILNQTYPERFEAVSAGTEPTGYVHPKALEALREIGIEHEGRSKSVREFEGREFDLILTVCDSAAEACPRWPGTGKTIHHSFPDPASSDDMEEFRSVRDEMLRILAKILG